MMLAVLEAVGLDDFVTAGMEGTVPEDVLTHWEVHSYLTPMLIAYAIDFSTTRDLWNTLAN